MLTNLRVLGLIPASLHLYSTGKLYTNVNLGIAVINRPEHFSSNRLQTCLYRVRVGPFTMGVYLDYLTFRALKGPFKDRTGGCCLVSTRANPKIFSHLATLPANILNEPSLDTHNEASLLPSYH